LADTSRPPCAVRAGLTNGWPCVCGMWAIPLAFLARIMNQGGLY
jgi:hypothetical protein